MADRLLELISAVAAGDAAREDVVAALRDDGIDSLDVLVEVLAGATRKTSGARSGAVAFDPQRPRPAARTDSVHQVPRAPFMLRGTLYDPGDIERFNGQELHLVGTPGKDHLLAVDDRELIERWWQLSYISSYAAPSRPEIYLGAETESLPGGGIPTDWSLEPPTGGGSGPESFGATSAPGGPPRGIFYEDIRYGGSDLELPKDHSYSDLTEVAWTFFGTGDWNDEISSVQLVQSDVAVLCEHVAFEGSSYSAFGGHLDLTAVGFNDRASSIVVW